MRWQFWQQPSPQKLSDSLRKAVLEKFPLEPHVAERILFLGRKGRFSGRPANYIRIFDPSLLESSAAASPTYHGLLENHEYRPALLFEGRTETIYETEQIFLTDRRIP